MATTDRFERPRGAGRLCATITSDHPRLVTTRRSLLPVAQSLELLRRLLRAN